jgi:hypothetical protein
VTFSRIWSFGTAMTFTLAPVAFSKAYPTIRPPTTCG